MIKNNRVIPYIGKDKTIVNSNSFLISIEYALNSDAAAMIDMILNHLNEFDKKKFEAYVDFVVEHDDIKYLDANQLYLKYLKSNFWSVYFKVIMSAFESAIVKTSSFNVFVETLVNQILFKLRKAFNYD